MGKPTKTLKRPDENDKRRKLGTNYDPEAELVELPPELPPPDPAPSTGGQPKGVRCMADIKPEPVRWLWPGYLAAGKLALLVGDPGLGKSMLTCEIVARFSRGDALPGAQTPAAPLVCGLCCPEDDPGDTIRPRLDAAATDAQRVYVLDHVRTFPDDLESLESEIRRLSLGLVVIDPIMSFLSGKHDSHRDQDVRRALTPLVELAQRTGCAVLAVMHLNKKLGGGQLSIGPVVRSGLLALLARRCFSPKTPTTESTGSWHR